MRHHDLIIVGAGSGNSIPDERFADLDIAIIDDGIVLAAGSRAMVPAVPGLETIRDRVHTSDTIMRIDSLPASIVILGGGVIAAEMAGTCACRGRR